MTIPNVVMRWCQKQAQCQWCPEPITVGTPMVAVLFWNKGNPDSRRFNVQKCYHPQCWVEQGLDYLTRNPFVVKVGRKKSQLSDIDRRQRFLLIRRFNALVQRKHNIKDGYPDSLIMDAKLSGQMVNIMLEVAVIGGIPKSWIEKL